MRRGARRGKEQGHESCATIQDVTGGSGEGVATGRWGEGENVMGFSRGGFSQ